MGHDFDKFWISGLLDFQIARAAYMQKNGIEEKMEATEDDFDNQYEKAAKLLKEKGLL